MGFDAAEAVPTLDWTFKPHVDAEGIVPEPTTAQVGAFFDQMRIILDRPEDETVETEETDEAASKTVDILALLKQMAENEMLTADDKLIAAYSDLCSNCPTAEQIAALPHRPRQSFFGWITGQLADPT